MLYFRKQNFWRYSGHMVLFEFFHPDLPEVCLWASADAAGPPEGSRGSSHTQHTCSIYIYIYAFSRRFYPKRLTVHSGYTFVLWVCVFPGNWTHNLCRANAMLYHWATGTRTFTFLLQVGVSLVLLNDLHDSFGFVEGEEDLVESGVPLVLQGKPTSEMRRDSSSGFVKVQTQN